MALAMNFGKKGLELLKKWELYVGTIYKDSAGLPTIGYGHLLTKSELLSGNIRIKGVSYKLAEGISEPLALALLDQDIDPYEAIVNQLVKVPLTQNQFDALVIFTFNIGVGGFASSSASKSINNSKFEEVPDMMRRWNKITDPKTKQKVVSKGLVNRRNKEIALFLS